MQTSTSSYAKERDKSKLTYMFKERPAQRRDEGLINCCLVLSCIDAFFHDDSWLY